MCGIFGTLRPTAYPVDVRRAAAAALLTLGAIAEERGSDSAGLATLHDRPLTRRTRGDHQFLDRAAGRARIVTALGPFSATLPNASRITESLRSAHLVLGHTRWATQGAVDLSNCSPMAAGQVLGTHNGDIAVPRNHHQAVANTDSAWLFDQLNQATTVATAAAVLAGIRGRAALAWINANRSGSLFLARAAMSPLSTANDAHGGFWWASNPGWLRQIAQQHQIDMDEPRMMLEGTVMELRSARRHVDMVAQRRFLPTARPHDHHLADAVWRGFNTQDRAADRNLPARLTHPDSTRTAGMAPLAYRLTSSAPRPELTPDERQAAFVRRVRLFREDQLVRPPHSVRR